ncbi:MAG: galactokinase [Frankiaceae bacterium]|nr:galactokinase [Frankiaceae bacterium]
MSISSVTSPGAPVGRGLVDAFTARYGRAPEAVWRAPGRVNLIGDHTDYAGGLALPFAIDRAVLVAGAARDDDALVGWSVQRPGDDAWLVYAEGVRRAATRRGLLPADGRGADLLVDSDLPVGAGLSSSAALTVAVAGVLLQLAGREAGPEETAALCQEAENVTVGVPTGLLDQTAVLQSRTGHVLAVDFRHTPPTVDPIPCPLNGLQLLAVDTRVAHEVADGTYAERRRAVEAAATELGVQNLRDAEPAAVAALPPALRRRAQHVVTENERVTAVVALLRGGRTAEIGPLLTASHASLRDDFEVSCPELDLAVDAALRAGALGARMTGAGFGGTVVVLVREDEASRVIAAVEAAFDDASMPSRTTRVEPGEGARALR